MKNMHYRTISWWITWEDLDFPNTGIAEKMRRRAKAAAEAGVELVVIFGCHFRWDFVCCFDTLHALIRFITEECHKYGIKVLDHHSAVLTHRPRNWAGREDTFQRNHHHVPFTPDRDVCAYLQYNGTRLNSWREIRVDDGTPAFITAYQCELFCSQNPDFIAAYTNYAARLFRETGIDGLMCDDICRYAHWAVCGCEHCRDAYRQITGKSLPPIQDRTFWGNVDNPDFRAWIELRQQVPPRFLDAVRAAIPKGALLTSCCSCGVHKGGDADALDILRWAPKLNTLMLEMCGSVTGAEGMAPRAADVLLEHQLARSHGKAVLGVGYAYYPDEAFLVWSYNRFFNNDPWVSTHKTRLGIPYDEQAKLPDEPEMVREAYTYEKTHQELFEMEDIHRLGLLCTSASRAYNGDCVEDYEAGVRDFSREAYLADLPFTVVGEMPDAREIPCLLLSDEDCLPDATLDALEKYRRDGGVLLLCGLFGNRDETGALRQTPALARYGLTQKLPAIDRTLPDFEKFVDRGYWNLHRRLPAAIEYEGNLPAADKNGFHLLDKGLYWQPARLHDAENRARLLQALPALLTPLPVRATCPPGILHRLYRSSAGGYILHCMPTGMECTFHPTLRFQGRGARIVQSITYPSLTGEIRLEGDFREATLYSPDLDAPREIQNGVAPLEGLRRFFTIRLK